LPHKQQSQNPLGWACNGLITGIHYKYIALSSTFLGVLTDGPLPVT